MPDIEESVQENYRKAFGKRVGFGQHPALLLVDFVQAYFDPQCDLYAGVETALASALRVRQAARQARVPVVLTRVVYQAGGLDGGRFFEKVPPLRHFLAGAETAAWPSGLVPQDDETVVSKQYPSAFFGTSLASMLTACRVDSVILAGLTTSGCVRATCVDSMSHGFTTIVVRDACGDRHAAPHEANLFDMDAKYADVIGEDDALTYLGELRRKRTMPAACPTDGR